MRLNFFLANDRLGRDLPRLAGVAGVLVSGRVTGAAASLLFAIALARTMPMAEVGVVLTGISSALLSSIFATLYIESGSIRFLVRAKECGHSEVLNGFIFAGRMTLLCATPIVCGAFVAVHLLSSPALSGDRILMIASAALSVPVIAWLRLSGSHGTALGDVLRSSLPRSALQPLLQLVFFTIYSTLSDETPGGAMTCVFASFGVTAIMQFLLLRKAFVAERSVASDTTGWRDWLSNGLFLAPLALMQEYLQHAVVLAASLVLEAPEIAVLGLSLRFIAFLRFGILAVNMVVSPKVSRAIARGDASERDRHLRAAAILKALPASLAALAIALYADQILLLFGTEYAAGGLTLSYLTLIPVAAAIFGPNQMLLNISGERRLILLTSLIGLGMLGIAVPFGALEGGIVGAAAGAALSSIIWELLMYVSVRRSMGVDASIAGAFFRRHQLP